MQVCKILFIENQKTQFETIVGFFETINGEILKELITYIIPGNNNYDDLINNVQKYIADDIEAEKKNEAFAKILSIIKKTDFSIYDFIIFEIYPRKDGTYDNFIDNVRVHLNNNYKDKINFIAQTYITKLIDVLNAEDKFDFVIIDHKLVGCHNSRSGVHLAELLRKHNAYKYKIIFLSRNTSNDKQVTKEFSEVSLTASDYIWITKGYAGVAILQEDYFRTQVINEIKRLFQSQDKQSIDDVIRDLRENIRLLFNTFDELNSNDEDCLLDCLTTDNSEKLQYFGNNIQTLHDINTSLTNIDGFDLDKAKNIIENLRELCK